MLSWALTFLVVALIAVAFGFGGVAGLSIEFARILVFIAVVIFVVRLVSGRRGPRL